MWQITNSNPPPKLIYSHRFSHYTGVEGGGSTSHIRFRCLWNESALSQRLCAMKHALRQGKELLSAQGIHECRLVAGVWMMIWSRDRCWNLCKGPGKRGSGCQSWGSQMSKKATCTLTVCVHSRVHYVFFFEEGLNLNVDCEFIIVSEGIGDSLCRVGIHSLALHWSMWLPLLQTWGTFDTRSLTCKCEM